MKLCKACNGPVCPYCGGCIHEGECSCETPEVTALKARIERLQKTSLERLFLLWSIQSTMDDPGMSYQEIYEAVQVDFEENGELIKIDQDDESAIDSYLREHGIDPDRVSAEMEKAAWAALRRIGEAAR